MCELRLLNPDILDNSPEMYKAVLLVVLFYFFFLDEKGNPFRSLPQSLNLEDLSFPPPTRQTLKHGVECVFKIPGTSPKCFHSHSEIHLTKISHNYGETD